jgi:hypothetical protein
MESPGEGGEGLEKETIASLGDNNKKSLGIPREADAVGRHGKWRIRIRPGLDLL